MIVKMIQNLEIKMESQINSLETRIEKMQERFNKDLPGLLGEGFGCGFVKTAKGYCNEKSLRGKGESKSKDYYCLCFTKTESKTKK